MYSQTRSVGNCMTQDAVETIFEAEKISAASSSTDPPMEEWSSLIVMDQIENPKLTLFREGKYDPGSGEVCAKYIPLSDSDVFRHPYYNYPCLHDPGIETALLGQAPKKKYDEHGKSLYLDLCEETKIVPVRLFYKGLFKDIINLKCYGVNPNGVRNMCLALAENKTVQVLDLTSNFLNYDACFHLGELIAQTTTVKELVLAQCRIGLYGLKRLISSLYSIKLDRLDLSANELGDDAIALLAEEIIRGAGIKRLNLSRNSFSLKGVEAMSSAFMSNKICTHLDLSWNSLYHQKAFKALVTALYDSPYLTELNLSRCQITGNNTFANILMAPQLRSLDLSYNCLSPAVISAIGTRLRTTKNLKILNLSCNPIGPREALQLLMQLRFRGVKLELLSLDEVEVTEQFANVKKKILTLKHRANTTITHGRIMTSRYFQDADMRNILLKRLNYLGKAAPGDKKVDIPAYFLKKRKQSSVLLPREMITDMKMIGSKIDKNIVEKICTVFPGPKIDRNTRAIDLESITDYVARLWPNAVASSTPPNVTPSPSPIKTQAEKKKK